MAVSAMRIAEPETQLPTPEICFDRVKARLKAQLGPDTWNNLNLTTNLKLVSHADGIVTLSVATDSVRRLLKTMVLDTGLLLSYWQAQDPDVLRTEIVDRSIPRGAFEPVVRRPLSSLERPDLSGASKRGRPANVTVTTAPAETPVNDTPPPVDLSPVDDTVVVDLPMQAHNEKERPTNPLMRAIVDVICERQEVWYAPGSLLKGGILPTESQRYLVWMLMTFGPSDKTLSETVGEIFGPDRPHMVKAGESTALKVSERHAATLHVTDDLRQRFYKRLHELMNHTMKV